MPTHRCGRTLGLWWRTGRSVVHCRRWHAGSAHAALIRQSGNLPPFLAAILVLMRSVVRQVASIIAARFRGIRLPARSSLVRISSSRSIIYSSGRACCAVHGLHQDPRRCKRLRLMKIGPINIYLISLRGFSCGLERRTRYAPSARLSVNKIIHVAALLQSRETNKKTSILALEGRSESL